MTNESVLYDDDYNVGESEDEKRQAFKPQQNTESEITPELCAVKKPFSRSSSNDTTPIDDSQSDPENTNKVTADKELIRYGDLTFNDLSYVQEDERTGRFIDPDENPVRRETVRALLNRDTFSIRQSDYDFSKRTDDKYGYYDSNAFPDDTDKQNEDAFDISLETTQYNESYALNNSTDNTSKNKERENKLTF